MTARTTPPFRADHVGSFLRPKYLLDAREQFFVKTEITAEQLRVPSRHTRARIVTMSPGFADAGSTLRIWNGSLRSAACTNTSTAAASSTTLGSHARRSSTSSIRWKAAHITDSTTP